MHSFIMDHSAICADKVIFPRDEAIHAFRVLRLKPGDSISVSDGAGRKWFAKITVANNERVEARITESASSGEPPIYVTLYQGLPKADKLEWIIQKATELGVSKIVPVFMSRVVVKPVSKYDERHCERNNRIAREATKQCARAKVPEILKPVRWSEMLDMLQCHDLIIMPWEEAKALRISDLYNEHSDAKDIAIIIGPEGGITADEAEASKAKRVTLGPRILRTETAAIASLTQVMQLWGDL